MVQVSTFGVSPSLIKKRLTLSEDKNAQVSIELKAVMEQIRSRGAPPVVIGGIDYLGALLRPLCHLLNGCARRYALFVRGFHSMRSRYMPFPASCR